MKPRSSPERGAQAQNALPHVGVGGAGRLGRAGRVWAAARSVWPLASSVSAAWALVLT